VFETRQKTEKETNERIEKCLEDKKTKEKRKEKFRISLSLFSFYTSSPSIHLMLDVYQAAAKSDFTIFREQKKINISLEILELSLM
jgi:hypothetical protein